MNNDDSQLCDFDHADSISDTNLQISEKINNQKLHSRYRAKVDKCYPYNARDILFDIRYCFLGVSLENKSFSPGKFAGMIEWIARRSDHCLILIGDSIHRKTLQIRTGICEAEARERALAIGREFIANSRSLVEGQTGGCTFRFVTCSEVQSLPSYEIYENNAKKLFIEDESFRDSVNQFSEEYINKKCKYDNIIGKSEFINLSVEYFIEEISIFSCLVEQGFPIMIYPGSFSSLEPIVEGRISSLSAISPRGLISLQLKGR